MKKICYIEGTKPNILKVSLRMKLTVFLTIVSIFQIQASTYSQNKKITLDMPNATVAEVIQEIESLSDFKFLLNRKDVNLNREVSINVEKQKIATVLSKLFSGTAVRYEVLKKQIILRKVFQKAVPVKARTTSSAFNTSIQFQVSGTITDANGSLLPGASILEKGTTNGVQSDFDGNFSIEVADENATLVISYIGFAEKEVVVNGQTNINVQLEESAQGLNEVVVVGYGEKKRATITGAISTVKGEEFDKSPVTNFSNSFAGRVSGLTVVTRSGEPGSDNSTIRIRGSNTLGDNSPLIVIDGIPNRDMNRLNPANIENITVLKDASAAIYGAQAANGVILITTKRGIEGKPEITINVNTGFSSPTVLPNMADAATYAQMINELYAYDNIDAKYSGEDILRYSDGSDPWKYPSTDWYDETMKSEALLQTSSLELRGGSEWLKYFVSVGTRYQDGIYKNSATSYNQTDFRSNLDGKISDNINLSVTIQVVS